MMSKPMQGRVVEFKHVRVGDIIVGATSPEKPITLLTVDITYKKQSLRTDVFWTKAAQEAYPQVLREGDIIPIVKNKNRFHVDTSEYENLKYEEERREIEERRRERERTAELLRIETERKNKELAEWFTTPEGIAHQKKLDVEREEYERRRAEKEMETYKKKHEDVSMGIDWYRWKGWVIYSS